MTTTNDQLGLLDQAPLYDPAFWRQLANLSVPLDSLPYHPNCEDILINQIGLMARRLAQLPAHLRSPRSTLYRPLPKQPTINVDRDSAIAADEAHQAQRAEPTHEPPRDPTGPDQP